jgi:type VI secretion system protein VasD
MSYWPRVAGVIGMACLSGCAAPPPPPPPTIVTITLTATPDANPTVDNQGAPVAMRVYQLASAANFAGAEFFPLYQTDATALNTDLIHRDDFLLAPGSSKSETIMPTDPVKSIGIFAAYRDFQHATWRGTADIAPHKTTNITVTAGRAGITIKTVVAPPKPAS